MSADFCIGYKRFLSCKKDGDDNVVSIYEKDSQKCITMPVHRWAKFVQRMRYFDAQLETAQRGETVVNLHSHIGGTLFVSINSSLTDVVLIDFRDFYMNKNNCLRPTRRGISLLYKEWQKLKTCVDRFAKENECVGNAEPCSPEYGHANQEWGLSCPECNPPAFSTEYVS